MLKLFTAHELEAMRRDAKKRARANGMVLAKAFDQIAMEHGYRNWSLLQKKGCLSSPSSFTPDEWLFTYSIASEEFIQVLEAAVRRAPIIGTAAAAKPVVALAHYSRATDPIVQFKHSGSHSWTRGVSHDLSVIGGLTGLYGETFTSLYLIRITDDPPLRHRGSGHMEEYAIDRPLAADEFVRIPLHCIAENDKRRYCTARY